MGLIQAAATAAILTRRVAPVALHRGPARSVVLAVGLRRAFGELRHVTPGLHSTPSSHNTSNTTSDTRRDVAFGRPASRPDSPAKSAMRPPLAQSSPSRSRSWPHAVTLASSGTASVMSRPRRVLTRRRPPSTETSARHPSSFGSTAQWSKVVVGSPLPASIGRSSGTI